MDDFPIDEYLVFRKFVEKTYGHKCDGFSAGCAGCFIWAALETIENFCGDDEVYERIENARKENEQA